MKPLSLPFLTISLFASVIGKAQGATYVATCSGIGLTGEGPEFSASCLNEDQKWVYSTLNLDECFVNDGGNLEGGSGGDYSASCSGCLVNDEWQLLCDCETGKGSINYGTAVLTTNYVWNNNGVLDCYGHLGVV